jgi:nucleoside-diphosphate-sugar epimerase
MKVMIVGCGWVGTAIGRRLVAGGDRAVGVRRSATAAGNLETAGIEPLIADATSAGFAGAIPGDVDAVVVCVSPRERSAGAYRETYVEVNRAVLGAVRALSIDAYVYTGSTGVFGQADGGVVDERTPAAPADGAARALADAEEVVLRGARDRVAPTRIVRLSGLYGPGRLGVIERVRSGRLALGDGDDAWMNWCHLDDAVSTVLAAVHRGLPGGVYHGSDAHPATRREVVTWIAAGLGIDPPSAKPTPSDATRPNRRISSEKTRADLAIDLRFPSFREGLSPHVPR